MAKAYTKNGDCGFSSLGDGSREPKSHFVFEAVGAIDELSSVIGLARASLGGSDAQLEAIQQDLIEANAIISKYARFEKVEEFNHKTALLEKYIDDMDATLAPINKFILSGKNEKSARMHHARTVTRRAERRVQEAGKKEYAEILVYLNRLSSYFFVRARIEERKD